MSDEKTITVDPPVTINWVIIANFLSESLAMGAVLYFLLKSYSVPVTYWQAYLIMVIGYYFRNRKGSL